MSIRCIAVATALVALVASAAGAQQSRHSQHSQQARAAHRSHFTGDRAQARRGRAEFLEHNCYGCHGGLAGGGMGPSLRSLDPQKGGAPDSLYDSVLHGHPHKGMPDWEKRGMKPEEARALVTYIQSLRTDAEPTFFFGWKQKMGKQ